MMVAEDGIAAIIPGTAAGADHAVRFESWPVPGPTLVLMTGAAWRQRRQVIHGR
jgi:hypothetical protein